MVPFAAELSLTDLIGSVSVEDWNGLKYCLITRIEITIKLNYHNSCCDLKVLLFQKFLFKKKKKMENINVKSKH